MVLLILNQFPIFFYNSYPTLTFSRIQGNVCLNNMIMYVKKYNFDNDFAIIVCTLSIKIK